MTLIMKKRLGIQYCRLLGNEFSGILFTLILLRTLMYSCVGRLLIYAGKLERLVTVLQNSSQQEVMVAGFNLTMKVYLHLRKFLILNAW